MDAVRGALSNHKTEIISAVAITVLVALTVLIATRVIPGIPTHANVNVLGHKFSLPLNAIVQWSPVGVAGAIALIALAKFFVQRHLSKKSESKPMQLAKGAPLLKGTDWQKRNLQIEDWQKNKIAKAPETYIKSWNPPDTTTEKKMEGQLYGAVVQQGHQEKKQAVLATRGSKYTKTEKKEFAPAAVAADKGWSRPTMEDAHVIQEITIGGQKATLYGVFDGHGGDSVAKELASELGNQIEKELPSDTPLSEENVTNALTRSFVEIDKTFDENERSGSTAVCMLKIGDKLYFPNLGDSRAVLVHENGTQYQVTEDMKVGDPRGDEGLFRYKGENKSGKNVEVNRAVGDHDVGGIPPWPKVTTVDKGETSADILEKDKVVLHYPEGSYVVLACDGLWNVASTDQVGDFVRQLAVEEEGNLEAMSKRLVATAIKNGSTDNVSVMIVKL